jgi:predicted dienelactone hydrolase
MAGGVPASSSRETAGQVRNIEVKPDPRIKSLVLLAPATTHFKTKGALSGVNVPILLIVGDEDKHTPYDPHARMVLDGVPDKSKVCCRVVENAGHFSFLSPFHAHMVKATYPPSQDPSGFDRTRFLDELNAEIGGFLSQTLADAPSSEEIRSE